MASFNTFANWEPTMPTSTISSLDENDFLLLLQRQFPSVNVPLVDPNMVSKSKANGGANPDAIDKFRMPNSTSPLSTDSSPSPPSANDDAGSDGNNNNVAPAKSTSPTDDDHHKRKASADDFDDEINGQPSAKSQHTDPKTSKKATPIRRKSGSGEKAQDESRLLKRKEQNRAAQRAFRERKEKHVKDLEDKVAQLEAKTESQATENDNLRDILSRLQTENSMLKQATFTFAVPPSSANPVTVAGGRSRDTSHSSSESLHNFFASGSSVAGPSRVPGSARSSVATASTHDSPSSLFDTYDNFSGFGAPPADTPNGSPSVPNSSVGASTSPLDLDTMAVFGSPGPFTTISSNPMFTSYRDPIQSMNAFASFGGWDGDVGMSGQSSTNENSSSTLEGLFGDQFSSLIPFGGDFLAGEGGASASASKASPSMSSLSNGVSAGGQQHQRTESPSTSIIHNGECPKTKADVESMIANGPKGTFGQPPVPALEMKTSSVPTSLQPPSGENIYDNAFQQALGKSKAPKTTFSGDNYNIDELCLEMQRKAKCSLAGGPGGPCSS